MQRLSACTLLLLLLITDPVARPHAPAQDAKPAGTPPATAAPGGTIAFAQYSGFRNAIFTIHADGTSLTRVSGRTPEGDDASTDESRFSPDGRSIAYQSLQNGKHAVYLMARDGTDPHPVYVGATDSGFPAWSPDGSRLAFSVVKDGAA
ncbi:MAG TPA: hypothetical protein VMT34_04695, partial [Aggregatilineales bacterium]|nr:hypothetical protein [Aggregatilineales bacterium]